MGITDQEFIDEAIELFPDLKGEFEELDGLLHLQMDRFRYRVEQELVHRNKDKVLKSSMLAEKCFRYGSNNLKNAVDTSFTEAILVGHDVDTIKWGWELMPHILKELYVAFWGKNAI